MSNIKKWIEMKWNLVEIRPTAWVLGLAKFFLETRLKLHGEVWAKSCLENSFQPIWISFDHPSEASKLAIFEAF